MIILYQIGAWSAFFGVGGSVVFFVWRWFLDHYDGFAGFVLGMIPAIILGFCLGVIAALFWPLLMVPLGMILVRGQHAVSRR